ncbi:MAG TPA: hypothetical protein VHW02_08320 [Rhizomicrobium sp.]|nr:hypothetical protein [Rhizomicrobium sp.]
MNSTPQQLRQKPSRWRCGAPAGNRNRLVHGRYTREVRALNRRIREWRAQTNALLKLAKGGTGRYQ